MHHINYELLSAASTGDEKRLEILLCHPYCDPKAANYYQQTALMLASQTGHASCIQLLLPVSDVLARDCDDMPALMYAAHEGHTFCVQLLLLTSDTLAVDRRGRTASSIARLSGHTLIADLVDAYALAMSELTALHSVSALGSPHTKNRLRV